MAAVQSGCDYLLIPEDPPAANWRDLLILEIERVEISFLQIYNDLIIYLGKKSWETSWFSNYFRRCKGY